MMKLSITLLAIVIVIIPVLGFAESNTSEVKSEPGVVPSSDSAKVTPPQAAPIKKNKKKKKQGKAKKVSFEESPKNQTTMTEEEQKIMHGRNDSDKYRTAKKKPIKDKKDTK